MPAARTEGDAEVTAVAETLKGALTGSQPFIIGIAGGTASGKTTVCNRITQSLGDQRVALISLDEFYRNLTPEECANVSDVNFDEPAAFDVETLAQCLDELKKGKEVDVPIYDFVTSQREMHRARHVKPADVVIVEGILVLHIKEIVERLNMRIFVDTDDDMRLARRIQRDTVQRGRDVDGVINQYVRYVKPSFEEYVLPSKLAADVIIPWREDNRVAVDLISQHIRTKLQQNDLRRIYSNLHVMPGTCQTRGMHTKIRCANTPRQDFVFYTDRLIRLVVEMALGLLPFSECTVTTPTGCPYDGLSFSRKLCGVSIIRSGEAMENALRACCLGIKIGKILVARGTDISDSCLAYEKLPRDIAERHVLLMDPVLVTGQSAMQAIHVLTKHRGVDEGKIVLLTLMAAPEGLHKVCSAYPRLKVVTSEIETSVSEDGQLRPGVGDFGDRYFGTGSQDFIETGTVECLSLLNLNGDRDYSKDYLMSPKNGDLTPTAPTASSNSLSPRR